MTEILGHDIDGNPLRAGDLVVLVAKSVRAVYRGDVNAVVGRCDEVDNGEDRVYLDDGMYVRCQSVRKLPPKTDHEPADEEFTEWLKGMNVGQPE